jgi:hypothetical protein
MVTKNELVAIIAALTTDFDTPPSTHKVKRRGTAEAPNNFHIESTDAAVYCKPRGKDCLEQSSIVG